MIGCLLLICAFAENEQSEAQKSSNEVRETSSEENLPKLTHGATISEEIVNKTEKLELLFKELQSKNESIPPKSTEMVNSTTELGIPSQSAIIMSKSELPTATASTKETVIKVSQESQQSKSDTPLEEEIQNNTSSIMINQEEPVLETEAAKTTAPIEEEPEVRTTRQAEEKESNFTTSAITNGEKSQATEPTPLETPKQTTTQQLYVEPSDVKVLRFFPKEGGYKGGFSIKIEVESINWKRVYCHFNGTAVAGVIYPPNVCVCKVPSLAPGVFEVSISENTRKLIQVGTIQLADSFNWMNVIYFCALIVLIYAIFHGKIKVWARRRFKNKVSDEGAENPLLRPSISAKSRNSSKL